MIRHDFRCGKCGVTREVSFPSFNDFRRELPCECGGVAVQTWLTAPGLSGVEEPSTRGVSRTFRPGFDTQAGRHFQSRSERDGYLRAKGLLALGPEEWKRTMNTTPRAQNSDVDRLPGIERAMEQSWQELHAGKPAPEMGKIDMNTESVMMEEK